jgi:hypothetical protein
MPASSHAHFARFHSQTLIERHRSQVIDGHLRSQRDYASQFVHFAHGFIENRRNDAAMAMSRWTHIAFVQTKTADKHLAFLVEGKSQMHPGGIVRPAGKTLVLAEACTVAASMSLSRHKRKILYRPPNVGASPALVRQSPSAGNTRLSS